MSWTDIVSLLVGFYFELGYIIENIIIHSLILLYTCFPRTSEKYLHNTVRNALERSGYKEVLPIKSAEKYILSLFVLRYGFTETMLLKLSRYLNRDVEFLTKDEKRFKYAKVDEKILTFSPALLDDEPFEFCAGEILF